MNSLLSFLTTLNVFIGNPAEDITDALRAYVGPFLLIFIAIMAIKFVKDQQFMALISFVIIAIVVIIIFYTPGVLKSIATMFTGETGIDSSGSGGTGGGV